MTHRLEREQWLPAELDRVFGFFADASNLARITPPWLGFRIRTPLPIDMQTGAEITYTIRLAGVPLAWHTRIEEWRPNERFVDVQQRGPYALWHHLHTFTPEDGGVRLRDVVSYRLPFGPLGRLVHAVAVRAALAAIFDYRRARIAEIFPPRHAPGPRTSSSCSSGSTGR